MKTCLPAIVLALLLAGCAPSVDQGKVDAFAQCVKDTRPVVLEWVDSGEKTAGDAALDGLEFCGWGHLTDAEQAAYKAGRP